MKKEDFRNSKTLITDVNRPSNDPLERYLKEEYGIDNVMRYELNDLKDKDRSNFDVSQVRGNVQLQKGKIRTFQESEAQFNKVANRLKKYRPI